MNDPEGLRQRKKRATRQAISDVATALFVERGFDNVTVAEIAEAADVAKMTVFNYFPRKEDLFFDREGEESELVRAALDARPPGEPPLAALRRLAHELAERRHPFAKFSDATALYWRTVGASPALSARARELREDAVRRVARLLAAAAGRSQPDALASLASNLLVAAWLAAYIEAMRRQRAGAPARTVRAVFLELIDRGCDGVAAALKGTPYA
jgi:AcrR family transcriptional regulator